MTKIHAQRGSARGFSFTGVLLVLMLVGLVALGVLSFRRLEGRAPEIVFDRDFEYLGRNPSLSLTVQDPDTGLKHVSIRLRQGEQDMALVEELFDGPGLFTLENVPTVKSRTYDLGRLIAEHYQVQEGPASLNVRVTDYSLRGLFRGNRAELDQEFAFDIYPPTLEVFSDQHYINQGGSEVVVYRVSADAAVSGVQVGPHFFPGYPLEGGDAGLRFALFAFAYYLPADAAPQVVARDAAGNEAVAGFWHRVAPRAFRSRQIVLDDAFLQKVVPEIVSRTPAVRDQGSLLDTYVEINRNLRARNHETIAELSAASPGEFLWDGPFMQLSNSQVESFFADRRTYVYQGREVDQQDHVGFDLSVVQRYPIEAANSGRVIYADYFGIYGNTVLIDHGAGLVSLYAHMSSIDVEAGQMVRSRQVLGRSGATGLAGGDHLHFGLFLHGVPVNPIEWWDGQWLEDHILARLRAAREG